MFAFIKKILKRILPPPVHSFVREIDDLRRRLTEQDQTLLTIKQMLLANDQKLSTLEQNQIAMKQALSTQDFTLQNIKASIEDKYTDIRLNEIQTDKAVSDTFRNTEKLLVEVREGKGSVREILWSQIFNNSISGSQWLKEKNFAPGRWAIGYPLLYVLFSVLQKSEPQRILELGLGQSTHMITQYALAHSNVEHIVVEQSLEFAEFFTIDHELAPNTHIHIMPYTEGVYKQDTDVIVFEGFKDAFANQRFDLILIDAPSYNSKSSFNRVDILSILPDCLEESFVIILDDYNRRPEMNTAKEISERLMSNGISFKEGKYIGEKTFYLWCSENLQLFCSL